MLGTAANASFGARAYGAGMPWGRGYPAGPRGGVPSRGAGWTRVAASLSDSLRQELRPSAAGRHEGGWAMEPFRDPARPGRLAHGPDARLALNSELETRLEPVPFPGAAVLERSRARNRFLALGPYLEGVRVQNRNPERDRAGGPRPRSSGRCWTRPSTSALPNPCVVPLPLRLDPARTAFRSGLGLRQDPGFLFAAAAPGPDGSPLATHLPPLRRHHRGASHPAHRRGEEP